MGTIISFKGISKSFGDKNILDKVDLNIPEKDIMAILGPSGSGKSTLMKVLMGMLQPDSGKVFFRGEDITSRPQFLRNKMGLTTQENSFYDKLTIYENMIYYSNLYRVSMKRDDLARYIDSILDSVDLKKSKNLIAGRISGGMKRRLDFAISMVHDPDILILDEPTTGLDPLLVVQFWKIVKNISKRGKTIIVITHIFPEVVEYCTSASILNKGKITSFPVRKGMDLFKKFEAVVR